MHMAPSINILDSDPKHETCRNNCPIGLCTLWGTLFGAGHAKEAKGSQKW